MLSIIGSGSDSVMGGAVEVATPSVMGGAVVEAGPSIIDGVVLEVASGVAGAAVVLDIGAFVVAAAVGVMVGTATGTAVCGSHAAASSATQIERVCVTNLCFTLSSVSFEFLRFSLVIKSSIYFFQTVMKDH